MGLFDSIGRIASGAGAGAIGGSVLGPMGTFGIGPAVGGGVAGVNELGGLDISGQRGAQERLDRYLAEQAAQRERARTNQLGLVNQLQAPVTSPQYDARLRALESESQPTSLVEDPLFQGDRATLVQGGQQALSSIEAQRRGRDISGGFSNVGSVSDVYDRLGAQIAGLGQKSRAVKEQKRDVAAQARQGLMDAQTNFANQVTNARMAIEAGDSAGAMQAIQQAYAARTAADAAERQLYGQLLGVAGTIGGAYLGGPAGAMAGSQAGQLVGGQNPNATAPLLGPGNAYQGGYNAAQNMPGEYAAPGGAGQAYTGGYSAAMNQTGYRPYYQSR